MLELSTLVVLGLACFGLTHVLHYSPVPLWQDFRGWFRAKIPVLSNLPVLSLLVSTAVYLGHTHLSGGALALDAATAHLTTMNVLALTAICVVGERVR